VTCGLGSARGPRGRNADGARIFTAAGWFQPATRTSAALASGSCAKHDDCLAGSHNLT